MILSSIFMLYDNVYIYAEPKRYCLGHDEKSRDYNVLCRISPGTVLKLKKNSSKLLYLSFICVKQIFFIFPLNKNLVDDVNI